MSMFLIFYAVNNAVLIVIEFSVNAQYLHYFSMKVGTFIYERHWHQYQTLASDTINSKNIGTAFYFHDLIQVKHKSLTSTASLFDLIARLCIFVTKQPFRLNHSSVVCFCAFIFERVVQHANELMQSHCYRNQACVQWLMRGSGGQH